MNLLHTPKYISCYSLLLSGIDVALMLHSVCVYALHPYIV